MTPELRNLPHIASMAFNEPLLLEPAYARVFFCALAGQLGITRLTDTVSGVTLGAEKMAEPLALFGDDEEMGPKPARSYQVTDGIAVLPVSGTLVSKTRSLQPYSGMTGYNGIIARMRDIKPIWALANDMNCSAGQLIASAASRRLVTQTARTGSIGVMMAHSNYGAALKTSGVEVTLIYSGNHKVDGNPYEKLPKEVRADFQTRIDATRQMFAEKVAGYTGMSVQAVLDTEAAVFSGQESVDNGLAEQLVNNMDALNVMRDAIHKRTMISRGGSMKGTTASADTTQPAASADQTVTTVDAPAVVVTDPAAGATVDISSQVAAAVAAENGRIMGILNCEEAKGRESQARALAETPGMTVESAQRILAAAPQSALARTDTALDRLMETAPGTVTAGNASAEAGDDLLNTPV